MYPVRINIKETTEINTPASNLNVALSIERDGELHTSLSGKHDDIISLLQTFLSKFLE